MTQGKHYMGLAALLLVLSAVPAAMGQSSQEDSTAIYQTTTMAFRVTGGAANDFSSSTQQAFANQLRALLPNVMSVAVSDFTTGNGYVDVSVRAVNATNGQDLTAAWQKISSQALVTNTFMSTFNALLSNSAFQGNATLLSLNGASASSGFNVSIEVNMTLSGGTNLTPFMSTQKEALLTPINQFLGDHGTANITAADDNNGNVTVTMGVTMDANAMPGFWFLISNQTALQNAMPTLGGSSLKIAPLGFTFLSQVSTSAAPSPTASLAKATAPSASKTTISAPGTPPVSSSASGTATMNIDMALFGSSIVPFSSDKQFAAASSLAAVFAIIVGTGNANILTFSEGNVTSEPTSTAKGNTQQYGRKLLQAASSSGSSIPTVNVTFQVTLPTASQNSLLVLQSTSDTVKQQFAGWYVTQMAARGYTVDANLNSVTLSSTSPASPSTATQGSSSSGSSTNVGAIVGGVVGGVAAVALAAILALWLMNRRKRSSKGGKGDNLSESSDDIKASMYWNPTQKGGPSPIYTKDAEELKKTIESELSGGDTYLRTNNNLWESPIFTNMTELDSNHQEGVKRLLHKRRQQESQPLTETSANQAEALLSALSSLEIGSLYYDKYVVEQGQRKGVNSILAYATVLGVEPTQKVVIKFLPDHSHFQHERLFYENRQALEGEDAAVFIPRMLDAFSGSQIIDTADDEAIPPSLVLERGSFTLTEYLAGSASLEGKPEEIDRSQILYNLCKAVEFMHARNLVHGSLTPEALMWFSGQQKWKLIGFGNWARSKEAMHVSYDLRHAAPELVLADLGRMDTIAANEATDMWALGCIAFELLAGREVFSTQYSDEEVMSMLIGFVKLPWEENPDFFADNLPPSARAFVADLLQRSPEARKPIRTVLHSPLFTGDATGNGGAPMTEALRTPQGIFSTQSEWV